MPFRLTNAPATFQALMNELQHHQLFLKKSKCFFGARSIGYLGHMISVKGVSMDQDKVSVVLTWPMPMSVQAFLGLVGYYRCFIWDYGAIAWPLTKLLCKDGFWWLLKADAAFHALQQALTTAPVMRLPDFDKEFIIECNASGTGFSAVLHQDHGVVAFFSK
jgi:hypothetical protein